MKLNVKMKGQVSHFLIFVTLLLLFSVIWLSLDQEKNDAGQSSTLELDKGSEAITLKAFVENCLEISLLEGIHLVSNQGGYYQPTHSFETFSTLAVPYYIHDYQLEFPTKKKMEDEISRYILGRIPSCTQDLSFFSDQGYEIFVDKATITTVFAETDTKAKVDWPITLHKHGDSITLSEFEITKSISMLRIYTTITELMDSQKKDITAIHYSDIAQLAAANGFKFNLIFIDDETVLFNLIFDEKIDSNRHIVFNFIGHYSGDTPEVSPLEMEQGRQIAVVGREFYYQTVYPPGGVKYYDYSSLFDINPYTGVIVFIPKKEDIGIHYIPIQVEDEKGDKATDILELMIRE